MLQRVILSFRVRGNHNKINGVSNFVTKLIRLALEKPVIISIITTPSPFIARVTTRHDGQGTSDQPPRNLRRKPLTPPSQSAAWLWLAKTSPLKTMLHCSKKNVAWSWPSNWHSLALLHNFVYKKQIINWMIKYRTYRFSSVCFFTY